MKRKTRRPGKKALTFHTHDGVTWDFFLPGTRFDYQREVGDGLRSSVITAPLCWIMRAFPEAPVVVERREDDQWRQLTNHDLADLLRRPNPYYGGRVLMMATVMDICFGEAFWLKVRNGSGDVVELWWIPRALITPKWPENDPSIFISHYEYRLAGRVLELPPEDVVHFRFGMDPANCRRGFSQLGAVLREVYTDDQASNFTASILRNLGIIGIVFAPEQGTIPKEKADALKAHVQENFTADKRAQGMVFTHPMKTQVLQYNLQGFDVGPIRDIAEERVCAALGIPAAVVGFGTGLHQTKVGATMREMIQLAWKGGIMPLQEILADELDRSLLPDFQENTRLFRTQFDTAKVRALWEDESEKAQRVIDLVTANIITVAQGQRALGFPVDASQDKYARELTAPTPAPLAPNRAAALLAARAEGNGADEEDDADSDAAA